MRKIREALRLDVTGMGTQLNYRYSVVAARLLIAYPYSGSTTDLTSALQRFENDCSI